MTTAQSYMHSETRGIGTLLNELRYFRVPDHQREYAWTEDEVDQFLSDIETATSTGSEEYFLGLVVLIEPVDDGPWEILDGQQRLATTTMVYASIRDWLRSSGLPDDAHKIQEFFIGVTELGQSNPQPRLVLNVANRAIFKEIVVGSVNDDQLEERLKGLGRYDSNRLLVEALKVCRARIRKIANISGSDSVVQSKALFKLAIYLRDKARLVALRVRSTANAYMIFESLNDRGSDLSVLDLIKNHMFGRAQDRFSEIQAHWERMIANLGDRRADDFLKAYWTSRHGRIQRGQLFNEWRIQVNQFDADGLVNLAAELGIAADQFSALTVPDHEVWSIHNPMTKQSLRHLSMLGSRQFWPLMMAALLRFDPEKMQKFLNRLVIFVIRYQTVGKNRTGLIEIAGARIARRVFHREIKSPAGVWTELSALVSDDTQFRNDFTTYSEGNGTIARYMLHELESVRRKTEGTSTDIGPIDGLSVDHILPKNPSPEWAEILKSDKTLLRDLGKAIGNQCLVHKDANKKVGSHGFDQKRKNIYEGAGLLLTRDIARESTWTRQELEKRQQELAELAVRAWPLPQ